MRDEIARRVKVEYVVVSRRQKKGFLALPSPVPWHLNPVIRNATPILLLHQSLGGPRNIYYHQKLLLQHVLLIETGGKLYFALVEKEVSEYRKKV